MFTGGENLLKNAFNVTAAWVFARKKDDKGYVVTAPKARMVATDLNHIYKVTYLDTFASAPSASSVKIVVAVDKELSMQLCHSDVKQSFV